LKGAHVLLGEPYTSRTTVGYATLSNTLGNLHCCCKPQILAMAGNIGQGIGNKKFWQLRAGSDPAHTVCKMSNQLMQEISLLDNLCSWHQISALLPHCHQTLQQHSLCTQFALLPLGNTRTGTLHSRVLMNYFQCKHRRPLR
jgi:hypothetical protein